MSSKRSKEYRNAPDFLYFGIGRNTGAIEQVDQSRDGALSKDGIVRARVPAGEMVERAVIERLFDLDEVRPLHVTTYKDHIKGVIDELRQLSAQTRPRS